MFTSLYFLQARGQAEIYGDGRKKPVVPSYKPPSGRGGADNIYAGRNVEEAEYLQRLKQIRLQNFNDRRAQRERQAKRESPPP